MNLKYRGVTYQPSPEPVSPAHPEVLHFLGQPYRCPTTEPQPQVYRGCLQFLGLSYAC